MTKVKKKVKVGRVLIALVAVLVVGVLALAGVKMLGSFGKKLINKTSDAYLASEEREIQLYNLEFGKADNVVRGTKVTLYEKEVTPEDSEEVYRKITYKNKEYLVKPNYVVDKYEDSVREKQMFVRTPASLYEKKDGVELAGLLKKASEIEIVGFDKINEDGSVLMYEVKQGDLKGFVYSKYLVSSKEEASKHYDEANTYKVHAGRGDTLGAGAAKDLDFYPVEKPKFKDNVMPDETRTLYLNGGVLGNLDAYIKLAKDNNINAFVVDILDDSAASYASNVMKELSPTNYKRAISSFDDFKAAIKKLKDNGFYVIGRITAFKSSNYVTDHPDQAILSKSTGKPYQHNGSYWPSPYVRDVWEFNVKLAVEAVVEMGFHEIQFDYVRFPDRMYTVESQGLVNLKNAHNETKSQAIQRFLMYACDEIHKVGAYVSADVFGEAANTYVTAYGQYWAAISNVVDVISGMPYPDHFESSAYGSSVPVWTVPYFLMKNWGATVAARQKEIKTPAVVRTWIQAYNAIKPPYNEYGPTQISDQIRGLYENGLKGGYMTWNGNSNINKYQELAPAFRKSY